MNMTDAERRQIIINEQLAAEVERLDRLHKYAVQANRRVEGERNALRAKFEDERASREMWERRTMDAEAENAALRAENERLLRTANTFRAEVELLTRHTNESAEINRGLVAEVERLRERATSDRAEIERLNAAWTTDRVALAKENERLREALVRVRDYPDRGHASSRAREMQDISAAALHPDLRWEQGEWKLAAEWTDAHGVKRFRMSRHPDQGETP